MNSFEREGGFYFLCIEESLCFLGSFYFDSSFFGGGDFLSSYFSGDSSLGESTSSFDYGSDEGTGDAGS